MLPSERTGWKLLKPQTISLLREKQDQEEPTGHVREGLREAERCYKKSLESLTVVISSPAWRSIQPNLTGDFSIFIDPDRSSLSIELYLILLFQRINSPSPLQSHP